MSRLLRRTAMLIAALIITSGVAAQDATLEELRELAESIFPGNTVIMVDGAYTTFDDPLCLDAVSFPVLRAYQRPQNYAVPDDRGPIQYPLYANILIHPQSDPELVLPANISVSVIEPELDAEEFMPVLQNAYTDLNIPRASVNVDVVQGEAYVDINHFEINSRGNVFYKYETLVRGFVDDHWLAFDFTAENNQQQQIQVRGGIHHVMIYPYLSFQDFLEDQHSVLALSGLAYAATEDATVRVEKQIEDDERLYTVMLDTQAVLRDAPEKLPVPVNVIFTVVQKDVSRPWDGEIVHAEVRINGETLTEYTAEKGGWYILVFVEEGDLVSGDTRLIFTNDCGGYLQMDLIFRDLPLNQ